MKNKIVLLGLRGSIPVSGEEFKEFGCATSCMAAYSQQEGQKTEHAIVIDAGTGFLNVRKQLPDSVKKLSVLISHVHLDHIQGLMMLPEMFNGELEIDIYGSEHGGVDIKESINMIMRPPVWPVTPEFFCDKVKFHRIPEGEFYLGDVKVASISGVHPNDIDIFKLTFKNGDSVVHVGDYEAGQNQEADKRLKAFSEGCNILLMDGMYSMEEYEKQKGFGHSAWKLTAEIGKEAGAKVTKIIHHAPGHTDETLKEAEFALSTEFPNISFGREGEVIEL
ncbi:MAG: MBL fold metallo-hydrolase [Anaerovoracaceae bacterium]